jgi:hypothetical protein
VLASVRKTRRCLIVHEDTITAGFGAEIAATIAKEAFFDLDAPIERLAVPDVPSPHNPLLLEAVLPSVDAIARRFKLWPRFECDRQSMCWCRRTRREPGPRFCAGARQVGDSVAKDEPLVELETDKVTVEVPSPAERRLWSEILKQVNAEVHPDEVLARLNPSGLQLHRPPRLAAKTAAAPIGAVARP